MSEEKQVATPPETDPVESDVVKDRVVKFVIKDWIFDVLLIFILVLATYLRFTGNDWAQGFHLHPDERFLTGVEAALQVPESWTAFFDTATSSINPANVGHKFFVYGTFPIFIVRAVYEWVAETGSIDIQLVGRQLSAVADMLVIFFVYLLASRAFNKRVGVAAAAFSAFSVLPIQISHFWVVDNFLHLFVLMGLYFAVRVSLDTKTKTYLPDSDPESEEQPEPEALPFFGRWNFVLFGLALGMAVASKVSAAPLALMLPIAVLVRYTTLDPRQRWHPKVVGQALVLMVLAAGLSLLTFRIFQPYAFTGPSFFDVYPLNPDWVSTMKSLASQVGGDVDWPPSIQWARRPVWFSLQNMVIWGFGLPMGILAWASFLFVGWKKIYKREGNWQPHAVIWLWTLGYFLWQSSAFNPTMRYQLPIYATLAIYAGWGLIALWQIKRDDEIEVNWQQRLIPFAKLLGIVALGLTAVYAFGFANIYNREITRVAASRWIYENIPGPLNLKIETEAGLYNQPLSFPYDLPILPGSPFNASFTAKQDGKLEDVSVFSLATSGEGRTLYLSIYDLSVSSENPIISVYTDIKFNETSGYGPQPITFVPGAPVLLTPDIDYQFKLEISPGASAYTIQGLEVRSLDGTGAYNAVTLSDGDISIDQNTPFIGFTKATESSAITEIYGVVTPSFGEFSDQQTLRFELGTGNDFTETIIATGELTVNLADAADGGVFELDNAVELETDTQYYYRISNLTAGGGVTFRGSAVSNETSWDDGLPMRYNGYDGYGGIYQRDMNLDLYSDDSEAKLENMLRIFEQVDYVTISSSRVWANIPQIYERYPMTIQYYYWLLGCPEEQALEACYNNADVGTHQGELGFELVQVFQSNPGFGNFTINDQSSEEAFTVYDHPKVFIFKKTANYDHAKVVEMLGSVDLSEVTHVTPKEAGNRELSDLQLPEDRLIEQREGGTWSELFDSEGLINTVQPLTIFVWYFAVAFLGIMLYPVLRLLMHGLDDKGYPLSRASGMLLLAYLSWLAGSVGLGYERWVIWICYALLLALGVWAAYVQRDELRDEIREKARYFLTVEGIFLLLFLTFLFIRMGNPDLWHPGKGGEKPMDFAYFNAVIKSSSFPPYDPWFSGGYINYYYYGFVFTGTLVKMMGIMPAIGYNLVLPTLFSLLSINAFSAAWNLYKASNQSDKSWLPWAVGGGGILGVSVLGNLGTIRMFIQGYQRLGSFGAYDFAASFMTKWSWFFAGISEASRGATLPYGLGSWYWDPSRIINVTTDVPITEFPWFTFIYADLHAHMIAMPITMLVIGWVVSVVVGRGWKDRPVWVALASIAFGAVAIGALRPTNTWDFPTFLALGVVAVGYSILKYFDIDHPIINKYLPERGQRKIAFTGLAVALLAGLAFVLYQPFANWYVAGYTEILPWQSTITSIRDYLAHWGVFLFVIFFWLGWESIDWMALTPASSLRKLKPYVPFIFAGLLFGAAFLLYLHLQKGIRVHWIALPMAAWAAILLFRPKMPEAKRLMLFMTGTGLFLTVFVELVVLGGDIGRMNTVFKFYLQVWLMFGVVAAAGMGIIWKNIERWSFTWQLIWQLGFVSLVGMAALYPMLATSSKVQDRITEEGKFTLDGIDYMQTSEYFDGPSGEPGMVMDLSQDYGAIRWLQENVAGSPVIIEALTGEYHWGGRISINTGLPAVLGWRWHQTQQRVPQPGEWIPTRQADVAAFYNSESIELAVDILRTYDVSYIIVGQLEQVYYPGAGLNKFSLYEGDYWQLVFEDGDTRVYEVIRDAVGEGE